MWSVFPGSELNRAFRLYLQYRNIELVTNVSVSLMQVSELEFIFFLQVLKRFWFSAGWDYLVIV